jgi:DNA-binding IclR family transcriptional regulator
MTTLTSAADVLRCFSSDCRDVTVTQVARMLAMPKSNASRLLRAMASCGMLEAVGDSKRYRPGLLMYDAGRHYRLTSPFLQRVEDAAGRAALKLGAGAPVFTFERDRAQLVTVSEFGPDGRRLRFLPGARSSVFAAAAGLVLLARMSNEQIRGLAQGREPDDVAQTAMAHVERARRQGFVAIDRGPAGAGVEIAVAIGEPASRKEAALSVAVLGATSPAQRLEIARSLHEAAAIAAQSFRDAAFRPFDPEAA